MNSSELSALAKAAVDRTMYGYAKEYIVLDGKSFSFDGHNYLIDMYLDPHPYKVIEKSAQMGASVFAMIQSFFVCDKKGLNTIYFFPTDQDVTDFSKTRVAPLIRESDHLGQICTNDALGLRQVGRGWMYFRGMRSKIAMKSVPADCLIFDELDEMAEDAIDLADQRLNHSSLKWRMKLSTPTFEGYGIDAEFEKSDRRYWNLICEHCDTRNILEFQFPDCIRRDDETTAYLICRKCRGILNKQYGEWIPENKTITRRRGYHICGLYSEFLDVSELHDEWLSGRKRPEFMRSKLGIAYTESDMRIGRKHLLECVGDYEPHTEANCYMGVDQKGDALHITIRHRAKLTGTDEVLFIGKVRHFGELDDYVRRYDVRCCVIDGTPNQHSARSFASRFPGRVFLCYYNENQKGDYTWKEPPENQSKGDQQDWAVTVNRTEALDAMYEQIVRKEIRFPQTIAGDQEFLIQLPNLARVIEKDEDQNILGATYKRLGEDHYAHALSYSLIASSRFATAPKSIMVKSKSAARVKYSRLYEQGSQY